jgi:hypothetical protein
MKSANNAVFPERSAAQSGALQTRDRRKDKAWDVPGSAVQRFTLHHDTATGSVPC